MYCVIKDIYKCFTYVAKKDFKYQLEFNTNDSGFQFLVLDIRQSNKSEDNLVT